MQVTYCDICQALIKENDKKYILGINPLTETDSKAYKEKNRKDMQEYLINYYETQFARVKVWEICENCKKILYHLFKMRKEKREKILKTLEDAFKKPPKKKWGKK